MAGMMAFGAMPVNVIGNNPLAVEVLAQGIGVTEAEILNVINGTTGLNLAPADAFTSINAFLGSIQDTQRDFGAENLNLGVIGANRAITVVATGATTPLTSAELDRVSHTDGSILWNAATSTATIDPQGVNITFTTGSEVMTVGGQSRQILTGEGATATAFAPVVIDSRLFVPVRALLDAAGFDVSFSDNVVTATPRA